ncbi:MAG: hypothetical protein SF028_13610 [Candidatus Sumerlaeia bacterium]|nr:hypothetical protein [Candidatus Sumerlaeia bacterium]
MRLAIPVAAALALAGCASAPKRTAAPAQPFPDAWYGSYAGTMLVDMPGRPAQSVPMTLEIAPTEDPARWHWRIGYAGQPVRDYALEAVDADAGEYRIDENNSIVLDARLLGGVLFCHYAGPWGAYTVRYDFDGETMKFDLVSTAPEATSTTGGAEGVPAFDNIPVIGWQRAVLRRVP